MVAGTIQVDLLMAEARAHARRRRLKNAAVLVVVTGGIAVVLVSSLTFASNAGAALPNPCTLLSNGQAGKAMKAKVAWKQEVDLHTRGRSCQWTSVSLSPSSMYAVRHELTVMIFALSRKQFLKGARETPGAARVTNLGQIAYRTGGGVVTTLDVWQSGIQLTVVTGSGMVVPNVLSAETSAARAALARLTG